jgi:hypothetical protein
MKPSKRIPQSEHRPAWALPLLGACALVLVIAAAVVIGVVNRQPDTAPQSIPSARPSEKLSKPESQPAGSSATAVPAPVTSEPRPATATPASPRPAAAQADPFKAFLEASKNRQTPAVADQPPVAGQPVPPQDPFKSVAEDAKKRQQEVTISPFGR